MSEFPPFPDLDVRPSDMKAARVLLGLTQAELASLVGCSMQTVHNLEAGARLHRSTWLAVMRRLTIQGIAFAGPGVVQASALGRAPTVEAVGRMTGARMRRARFALKAPTERVAMAGRVSQGAIATVESLSFCGQGVSPIHFYKVFNGLERLGYQFGRTASMDRIRPE